MHDGGSFTDKSANKPQTYYYVVKAADKSLNTSVNSAQVSATPTVVPEALVTPGGPRVHRTFMLDSMLAGVSPLDCYEPLQVARTAQPGLVAIQGVGNVTFFRQRFSPNRVQAWVVVGHEPARVVLNQNFAAGWTTSVGPVVRDPDSRRPSVVLPAGYAGSIAFTFVPPGLWAGLVICAVAVAVSILVWRAAATPGHPTHL